VSERGASLSVSLEHRMAVTSVVAGF
jgi:hypothetical protein